MVKSISNWKWNILFRKKKKNDADCRKEDKKDIVKNKVILKTQQRFKSERHNIFTEVINKIALSSIGDKRMQSVDAIEKYAYGTSLFKTLWVFIKTALQNNILFWLWYYSLIKYFLERI